MALVNQESLDGPRCTACKHLWHGLPCGWENCLCRGPWWEVSEAWTPVLTVRPVSE